MTTPNSSAPSPPASTTALAPSKKCWPLKSLHYLADRARATQGLLTPTETLELIDIAEHYKIKLYEADDLITQLTWDLEHPKHKDM